MLRCSISFGGAAVFCTQASLCPRQCIAPAIKDAKAELAVGRAAPSRCFGGERLRSDGETSLCKCCGCSVARQQRIWSLRNDVCHLASPSSLAGKPLDCSD